MEIYSAEKLKTVKLHERVVEERLWLLEGGGAFWCRLFGRAAGEIFWGILCLGRGNRERNGRSFSGERGEGVLRERGECWNQRVREKHSRRTEESACSFLLERSSPRCGHGRFLVHIFLSHCFSRFFCVFNSHSLFTCACPANI